MNKTCTTILVSLVLMIALSTPCLAGWLIYHKPAFKGKVIDAETKEPIQGAVVVVLYNSHPIISGPGGGSASTIKIKEALTNEEGEFYFPPYTTVIQPNSIEFDAGFIIYKPGYGDFRRQRERPPKLMSSPALERYFWEENFGREGEILLSLGPLKKGHGTYGLVELPRVATKEERLRAMPLAPTIYRDDTPLLYQAINEERGHFRLDPVGR